MRHEKLPIKHMRYTRNLWSALVFLLAACSPTEENLSNSFALTLGETLDISQYAQVDGSHTLSFPQDHGPHNEYLSEWWYVTSVLQAADGREFGTQFTVFRRSLSSEADDQEGWRSGQIYMSHVALSDVETETHFDDERISRQHSRLAGASSQPFHVHVEDWSLKSQGEDFFPLNVNVTADGFSFDLQLTQGKPIVLHGENGWSRKSPAHASYYYSIPRMITAGTVTVDDSTYEVEGLSWMDREWSSGLLGRQFVGWYWFALSFDDGMDLVLFSLRNRKDDSDANRVAMWVNQNSSTQRPQAKSWSLQPTRYWRNWPIDWKLEIEDRSLFLTAKFDDQEMNTSIPYWEGLIDVREDSSVIGSGYMELTGY